MTRRILIHIVVVAAVTSAHTSVAAQTVKPGYYRNEAGKELKCPKGTYNSGQSGRAQCSSCPAGFTTLFHASTTSAACVVQPGWEVNPATGVPRPCDQGTWSSGGTLLNPKGRCIACPAGFTTQVDESKRASDCEICLPGHGGPNCALCAEGSFSSGGGKRSPCSLCDEGYTSASGSKSIQECYESMMLPDRDYFPLSDNSVWTTVAAADIDDCKMSCSTRGAPLACIMYRWSDAEQQCQHLLESQTGSLLGFKVSQGADYVIYTVKAGLRVLEEVRFDTGMTVEACMKACNDLNICEGFAFPDWAGRGPCRMFGSVLDEYQSMVHVSGRHLYSRKGRA